MPIVSMFYGIIVRMYADDHNPPHMHVEYQGAKAVYSLEGDVLSGELPRKQHRLVAAWAAIHEDELKASWEVCHAGEQPMRIDPLR
ncbi:hypothetical protein CPA40_07070 [Bifidobacterium callitrichos]|uniref:DUF4160 domain-containing protein n=1 Tax=Bifidobacterium callitrichos TaxID=762209 RepID=A0A2T3G9N3_9BIFI|nr:DUF4160 domain-containing protein [Bifidobacterium callitrichos]PST46194.1 hypothetical protein CPA40_07070 [Bifidobacterium callitrichos]